jgi:hypothetical protein
MNKTLLILAAVALGRCSPCPAITSAEIERLIPALIRVESGGNDKAIGDSGRAVGCLQIWPVVVEDVNRLSGMAYTLKDRLDRQKSVSMARIYLLHYGKGKNMEQTARIWNGGPRGDTKKATVEYWEKVKKEIK